MWDLIVSVPDHCLSFYFGMTFHSKHSCNQYSYFFFGGKYDLFMRKYDFCSGGTCVPTHTNRLKM